MDASEIIERMNSDLNHLATWVASNGLVINTWRTFSIWFGSRSYVNRLRELNLRVPKINDVPMEHCNSVKILGITLDSTLSWFQQCAITAKKCHGALARLRKCSNCIPRETKLALIKALVFPYLDYCSGLSLSLSKEMLLKLDRCCTLPLE